MDTALGLGPLLSRPGSSRATSSGNGRPTGRRWRGASHRASPRAGVRPAATDPPAGAAAPPPRARTLAPARRGRPERAACRSRSRSRARADHAVRSHMRCASAAGITRPRRHELDVPLQRVGQPHPEVGRPHPDALAQLGQPAVGQGPAAGAAHVGRAPRRRHHGQPPLPVVGGGRTGAAGRLARLARRQVTRQPVPAGPVGGGLAPGDHATQSHPGPVLADAEEAGQAHELGHRQLGRIHAEQRAGQDGPGRERRRRLGGPGSSRGITRWHHVVALRGCVT